jgi:hypothetical protein
VRTITTEEYSALLQGAEILSLRREQPKVFRRENGLVYKLIRAGLHWKASGPVRPGRRFAHNARRLSALGIASPSVVELLHLEGSDRDLIVYQPLEGESLNAALSKAQDRGPLRRKLAESMARFHRHGVYFAAGHLSNYILLPDGEMGLIDVHDVWISLGKLGAIHRARSFRILLKYAEDRALLGVTSDSAEFIDLYLAASGLGPVRRRVFRSILSGKLTVPGHEQGTFQAQ